MPTQATHKTILSRNEEILFSPINQDQAVMMSIESQRYYGLDAVGLRIWELLDTPRSIDQIVAQILTEFAVDEPTCQAAVLRFAQEMIDHGVARVIPA